jgi:hypothetical protein
VEWESDPLVPVTETVKVPLVVGVQERVEVPEPVTPVGVKEHVSPVAGLVLLDRLTVLLNPLTAVTVIVEVPVWPTLTEIPVGLELIVKSLGLHDTATLSVCTV